VTAKRDAQSEHSAEQASTDKLTMPQEDDPAGDGHMWSGKGTLAADASATQEEFADPTHIPTHGSASSSF
jgi:hypothetical protein